MWRSLAAVAAGCAIAVSMTACSQVDNDCGPRSERNTIEMAGDWPYYADLDEAFEASDLVVVAEHLGSEVGLRYPIGVTADDPGAEEQGSVTTFNDVRISEVMKGEAAPGDEIVVAENGGCYEGTHYVMSLTTYLSELDSESFVLFVSRYEDYPYYLINPYQGVLMADGEEVRPLDTDGVFVDVTNLDDLRAVAARR